MKESYDNKKEIIRSLSTLFGDVSKPLRASLIGLKIEKILSKYYDNISNEQIAQSLITQFGSEALLAKNKIFEKIVYGLDENELNKLAQYLNTPNAGGEIYDNVVEVISKKYEEFLRYYKQSDYFKIKKEKDSRVVSEEIEL